MMIMGGGSLHLLHVLVMLLLVMKLEFGFNSGVRGEANIRCIEKEREALLKFRQGLVDDYGHLSSWGSEDPKRDCCKWRGIMCSNRTNHVIKLNLHVTDYEVSYKPLRGKISPSLLELRHLSYLDLSYNDFGVSPVPAFIGHLTKLRHLNLSSLGFGGTIPHQLGNLTNLHYLDLSYNNFGASRIPAFIGHLTKLRHIDLSSASFGGTFPYELGNLTNLHYLNLGGNLDFINVENLEWLSHLSSLRHLDMSGTNLSKAIDWLQAINMLPSLSELHLSYCQLSSVVPPSLSFVNSSISHFAVLDLSYNSLSFSIYRWLFNFNLSSLRHLDMSGTNFSKAIDWLQAINMLPSLSELHLSDCQLSSVVPPSLSFVNSSTSHLAVLDLSSNSLFSSIFPWLFNFSGSLAEVDLSYNLLQGSIPDAFQNMKSLAHLDFTYNQLEGRIPKSFGNMCTLQTLRLSENNFTEELPKFIQNLARDCSENSLEELRLYQNQLGGSLPDMTRFSSLRALVLGENRLIGFLNEKFALPSSLIGLDLSGNRIEGSLPDLTNMPSLTGLSLAGNQLNGTLTVTIGQLSSLESLDVSSNSLQGNITEAHLLNLPRLKYLDLSFNSFTLNFSSDWVPPFQLDTIRLVACKIGPNFPKWLQSQKGFSDIDISNSGISDSIPNWFWDLSPNLRSLNLSCNQISGRLPNLSLKFSDFPGIDLSFNHFDGPLPLFPSKLSSLDLSTNKFSGSISSICAIIGGALSHINLSNNRLFGGLPNCWMHFGQLVILNLANNNFSGKIPSSIGSLYQMATLDLHNNSFFGELPSTLKNCTQLEILDLGENKFSGKIPSWIGESLSQLIILSLRSNEFYGSIHVHLCHLKYIQILDISHNNISGTIPQCINNFTAMSQKRSLLSIISHQYYSSRYRGGGIYPGEYVDSALVVMKGLQLEYRRNLGLVKSIDLSSNKLAGEIPKEIASLIELIALNLSRNNLAGKITPKIGLLKNLESLDLCQNRISGEIPPSLSTLNFLGVLDLSNNSLSGKIPTGTQLQSFNASSYMGNLDLCGPPLPNKCPGDETAQHPPISGGLEEIEDGFITPGFYVSMGIGFTIGFWGVCAALLFKRSWRYAYFQFLNEMRDWLYVTTVVNTARLQRRFKAKWEMLHAPLT